MPLYPANYEHLMCATFNPIENTVKSSVVQGGGVRVFIRSSSSLTWTHQSFADETLGVKGNRLILRSYQCVFWFDLRYIFYL